MSHDRRIAPVAGLVVVVFSLLLSLLSGARPAAAQNDATCRDRVEQTDGAAGAPRQKGADPSLEPETVETPTCTGADIGTLADAAGGDPAIGQPAVDVRWDLADGSSSVLLTGYEDDATFDVDVPLGWALVESARLDFEVTPSEIARDDLSLRIDLDGRPIRTWSIGDAQTQQILLSPEDLHLGARITASTTAPLVNDDACPDPTHVGRWLDLGRPVVEGRLRATDVDVARAVAGLGTMSALTNQPVGIELETTTDGYQLGIETTGAVAAAIAAHELPAGWRIFSSESSQDPSSTDEAPPELAELAGLVRIRHDQGHPASAAVEVIEGRPVLTLAGDPDEVRRLAHRLADRDRLLYFHATDVALDSVPALAPADSREVFVFGDLGYEDRTLRGHGRQSLVYRLHVPAGLPIRGSSFALYATHAPELVARDSTVTLRLNDGEDEIVALPNEDGRIEILHNFAAALRPGLNYVTVTADLGQPSDLPCQSGSAPWITVSKQSGLATDGSALVDEVEIGVEDTRFALASHVDFVETDVVLPDDHDVQDLALAVGVIAELASRAEAGSPRLVMDRDVDLTRHLVFVGPVSDRVELARSLPGEAMSTELVTGLGLVVATPSPHASGRVVVAVVGADHDGAALAADAAMSPRVNDVRAAAALVGLDTVRPVGDGAVSGTPESLAFEDREAGPSTGDYEAWLLAQAARIDDAQAPQVELRRMIAFGLLLASAAMFGLAWIRRMRQRNAAGVGGSAGH